MGANSGIAWTDHTFNPWWGCVRVSPGCDHCYAEAWDKRTGGAHWGARAEYRQFTDKHWNGPRRWDKAAGLAGKRARVFCASMADVFDNRGPVEARARLWALIAETPNLDWLLLTKRPQNVAAMLPPGWGEGWGNVWLGTTCENQVEAERRIPHLRQVPAAVRFLSCEPLIGPVDPDTTGIHWIIAGGESGGGARPYQPEWARSLLAASRARGVAFFHKQTGSVRAGWPGVTGKGDNPAEWPADLRVQEFPASA